MAGQPPWKRRNERRLEQARVMANCLFPAEYRGWLRQNGIGVRDDGTLYIARDSTPSPRKQAAHHVFVADVLTELEA